MEPGLHLSLLHLGRDSSERVSKGWRNRPGFFFHLEQTQGETNYTSVPLRGSILISALTQRGFEGDCR